RGAAARLRNEGLTVVEVEVNEQGHISPEQVAATVARHPDVGLVSLALCNHELGNLFEIKNVVSAVRETRSDVLVHTDAIQAFGKVAIDFPDLGVDLLSLSAHKVYGPKGVGALVHRRGLKIQSLFFGGHQERGRRPGTENPALVAGFGVAASCAMEHLEQRQRHASELRSQLLRGLDAIPEIVVNGAKETNVGNTVNFSVPECEGQLLLINLDLEGIAVSTGAACSAGSLDPSHVLLALGVSEDLARSAIRVSFGRDNTAEDVQALLDVLPRAIAKVRGTA
ncbi:MAG: cysteine desulfurase family protein, partial [Nannocystaceae bacterium]